MFMTKDSTDWLNDGELQTWLALMPVVMLLPAKLEAQLKRDSTLGLYDYLVLAVLSEQPGRSMAMKTLSGMTNGSMSRLSHVVSRLEHSGWVVRRPDPSDGRITEAYLTVAGRRKVIQAAPGHVREVRALVVDRLSLMQVEQLREICATLANGLVGGHLPKPA